MNVQISLTPEEIELISQRVSKLIIHELIRIHPHAFRKHSYTPAEVGEQISYHTKTVLGFIRTGRKDENGIYHRLPAKEPTPGGYRILPTDLDEWLSKF